MARNLGTLEYLVDIDTSGVYAGAAEVEAVLKSIPDEKVNLEVDTNVESLRKARSELVKYQKLLQAAGKAGAFEDKRLKTYRDLPPELKKVVKEYGGWKDALDAVNIALNNNGAALSAWTYRQRIASQASERGAKALRDEEKALLEVSKLREKAAKIQREMYRRQRSPIALNTEVEIRELNRLKAELESVRSKYRTLGGDVNDLNYRFDEQNSRLVKAMGSIGDLRLHLGFFSMSVRQLALSLGILGPMLSGVLGAAGALIGTLGTGLVAAAGLAGGALAGLGLIATGVGLAIAPLFQELKTATKAATDYQKQVLKTGINSEEARDKLEDYRQTVKNLPPDTQRLIAQSGVLYTRWTDLTDALRKPFFQIAGYGIQALTRIMPVFASETQRAFKFITGASRQLLQGFGRAESRSIIQVLMRQTGKAVPSLLKGIGSLITAFARLSAASVRFLPKAGTAFAQWAQGIADATNQNGFQGTVNGMMNQLKSLGQLATSAGRLLITFFSAGASSGQNLVQTITGVFDRWTSWMRSIEGQKALTSFFENGVKEIGLLYNAITPIAKVFARWSEALRPFSQVVLEIVAVLGNGLEFLTRWKLGLQALAFASVVSTVISLAAALKALSTGLALVARNSRIAATMMALFSAGSMRGGIAGIMQMAASTKSLQVALGVLVAYGLYKLTDALVNAESTTERVTAKIKQSTAAYKEFNASLVDTQNATIDYRSAKEKTIDAWKRVNELTQAGMRGTNEWSAAIREAAAAEREQAAAQQRRVQSARQNFHNMRAEIQAAKEAVETAQANVRAQRAVGKGISPSVAKQATTSNENLARAYENLREVLGRAALNQLNVNRALKGYVQLAGPQVARVAGQFKAAFGKNLLKQRVTLEEDPKLAVKIAGYAAKLKELGKTKEARVVLKSDKSNVQVARELGKLLGDKKKDVKAEFSLTGNPKAKIAQLKKDLKDLEKGRTINVETSRARDRFQDLKREAQNLFDGVEFPGPTYKGRVEVGSATGGRALYVNRDKAGMSTRGGRYSRPSFLVGEENRPEYVIATNPAYRRSNIKYWMQAGSALGIPGFAGGGLRGKPPKKPTKTGNAIPKPPGNWHKAGYDKLKNFFIPWSVNETDATARAQQRLLDVYGTPKDYAGQIKDIERSIAMNSRLKRQVMKKIKAKKAIIADNKTGKDKRKQAKQDLDAFKQEYYVDLPQTLNALRQDKADLIAEQATGGGFGIAPALQQLITGQSEVYTARSTYGSNIGAGSFGSIGAGGMNFLGGRYNTETSAPPAGRSGGRTVNITNNYQEPPADPHTWSKNLAWEMSVG